MGINTVDHSTTKSLQGQKENAEAPNAAPDERSGTTLGLTSTPGAFLVCKETSADTRPGRTSGSNTPDSAQSSPTPAHFFQCRISTNHKALLPFAHDHSPGPAQMQTVRSIPRSFIRRQRSPWPPLVRLAPLGGHESSRGKGASAAFPFSTKLPGLTLNHIAGGEVSLSRMQIAPTRIAGILPNQGFPRQIPMFSPSCRLFEPPWKTQHATQKI